MTPRETALPRLALSLPNMAEPARLLELGQHAEQAGWDGVFLWDHAHGDPAFATPMADPWVVLGALACTTQRVVLGTAITPLARRRPQKLAREVITVDHLSGGRMVLGVGLGEPPAEYTAYGESSDRRVLADKLDEALEVITGLWSGERFRHHGRYYSVEEAQFLPTPVRGRRVPIWASCVVPATKPLARAARWDGVILARFTEAGTIEPVPVDDVRAAVATIREQRAPDAGEFDVAISYAGIPSPQELADYAEAGVTWTMSTGWIDQLDELIELAGTAPR